LVLESKGVKTRPQMEQWLNGCTIRMHYFKTDDFEFLNRAISTDLELHHKKRRVTLYIESALIIYLKDKCTLLNRSKISSKKLIVLEEPAQSIFNNIKIRLEEIL
jgi:hypothetical protein